MADHSPRPDPLFAGLEQPILLHAHYWEVKAIPDGFRLLASTEVCRVQALEKVGGVVYGTQFRPEAYIVQPRDRGNWLINMVYPEGYRETQPDEYTVLRNFFRTAGVLGALDRNRTHRMLPSCCAGAVTLHNEMTRTLVSIKRRRNSSPS